MRCTVIAVFLIVCAFYTNACFVAPNGTDSPNCGSTQTSPCASIQGCVTQNANITIVNLAPGNYTGQDNCNQVISKPISFIAESGPVKIICSETALTFQMDKSKGSPDSASIQIQGITFYNPRGNGQTTPGSGCVSILESIGVSTTYTNITNCTFIRCYNGNANVIGGAAVSNCVNNTSPATSNTLYVSNSNFIQNFGAYGGAVCLSGRDSSVHGSTFHNNTGAMGGGVLLFNGANAITSSVFSGNGAQNGGAIYSANTLNGTIVGGENLIITNNQAVWGGGIAIGSASQQVVQFVLTNSFIEKNMATYGGGVAVFAKQVVLTNTQIALNTAQQGAGIWVEDGYDVLNLQGTFVSMNHATVNGGGLYLDVGNPQWNINGLTVTNNFNATSESNLYCAHNSSVCADQASCAAETCADCTNYNLTCIALADKAVCYVVNCNNHGTCDLADDGWECHCGDGWGGSDCSYELSTFLPLWLLLVLIAAGDLAIALIIYVVVTITRKARGGYQPVTQY